MHPGRAAAIRHAWEDYEMGFLSRSQAEGVEDTMHADQRHERERLTGQMLVVDCRRCGAPIEVPELAYRGPGRHACVDCRGGGTTGFRRFVADEEGT